MFTNPGLPVPRIIFVLMWVGWMTGLEAAGQNLPDRIILTWTDSPARTQAVTWRTEAPGAAPQGQIALATAHPDFADTARTVEGRSQALDLEADTVYHHEVVFGDLEPGTLYAYRVGDGTDWSPWNHFSTAREGIAPFRFIYLGDAQNDLRNRWTRAVRSAVRHAADARFILFAGDLVNHGDSDEEWGEWCEGLGWTRETMPIFPVPGNHDTVDTPDGDDQESVPPIWQAHFALPENGPQGNDKLREAAFYTDYQGVRFISVDTNRRDDADQLTWLESVLGDNPNRWTIVSHHHPIYSTGRDRDNPDLRATLMPLYEQYGVDLVLQGHDHTYGRTHKVMGGAIVEPGAPGVIYANSVSGPKMYDMNPRHLELMAVNLDETQLYQVIEIDGERLAYEAYAIDGERVDGFELIKDEGGTRYVDRSRGQSLSRELAWQ